MRNRVEISGEQMKRSGTDQFLPDGEGGARNQFGALCWRMHRSRVEVLLITSRDTGRWVIPKGWPVDGQSPAQSAATEAWEEAGVRGKERDEALGFFTYDKLRAPKEALPCVVTVYPLRVEKLVSRFPERKQRRRRWFNAEKAAKMVAEPELRALLQNLAIDHSMLSPASVAVDDPVGAPASAKAAK